MKATFALILSAVSFVVLANAARFTVTFLPESSPTWPVGTEFNGSVAETEDPSGPFTNQSVMFLGYGEGGSAEILQGSHLIYRMRLDFDEAVMLDSFTEIAAGDPTVGGRFTATVKASAEAAFYRLRKP